MTPFLSVVVPVYKVEDYIEKCVDSLLCQTYKDFELVLVDDGSPDKCPEICDRYAALNDNVRCLHKPNGGLSSARNYGAANARGEFIVFVDSDDYVEKSYLRDLVSLRDKFDADLAITRIVREYENGRVDYNRCAFNDYRTDARTAFEEVYLGAKIGWEAYGKLYKKELLLKHPFPDGFYEDSACMYALINDCDKIAVGNYEKNYHYITREGSILNQKLDERHLHVFDVCDEVAAFIDSTYPELEYLKNVLYQRAVIQMLNLQKMDNDSYKKIFLKYRKSNRKSLLKILRTKKVGFKTKYYSIILCLTPGIYRLQAKIQRKIR